MGNADVPLSTAKLTTKSSPAGSDWPDGSGKLGAPFSGLPSTSRSAFAPLIKVNTNAPSASPKKPTVNSSVAAPSLRR